MPNKPTCKEMEQNAGNNLKQTHCNFNDISERKKAEEEILRWKNRYESAVLSSGHILYDWDSATNEIHYGGALEKILGYSDHEMSGGLSRWVELVHPDDRNGFFKTIEYLITVKKHTKFEYRVKKKNGEYIYIEDVGQFIEEHHGEITRMIGFVKDITDRKKAETFLREREELFSKIFFLSPMAMAITKLSDGEYVVINEKFSSIFGYDQKEIVGKTSIELGIWHNSKDRERFSSALIKNKTIKNMTLKICKKSGEIRLCKVSMELIVIKGELCIVTTIDDITKHKQVENALRENEEKYRTLFETESDALVLIEVETNNIIEVNNAFVDLYGYSRKECLQMKNTDFSAKPDEAARASAKSKVSIPIVWHKKKDGTVFPVEITSKVLKYHGQDIYIVAIRDNAERMKTEEALLKSQEQVQQTQKLEALGTLAGGIAHDFNNLLLIISGNISYALSYLEINKDLFELLSEVKEGAKRAQKLTLQLLTFAKGGEPVKNVVDLNQLIKETATFATKGTKSKCDFDFADNLWSSEIDEGQINHVIGNLVINANQNMPEGGIIQIGTENIDIDPQSNIPLPSGRYINIILKDHGIGISEKLISKIFDPYFSAKQSINAGLGLATAYSIIKKHYGHIIAKSKIGEGTTFNIYLPASIKKIKITKEIEQYHHKGKGNILIMDDEESILKMTGRMLKHMGYEPFFANDGKEVIEIYKNAFLTKKIFNLVILDLTVPSGMGGAKTIRELLKIDPKVKAIVSSGYPNDPVMVNFKKHGFCGVLPKPYLKNQLAEILNKMLGEKD